MSASLRFITPVPFILLFVLTNALFAVNAFATEIDFVHLLVAFVIGYSFYYREQLMQISKSEAEDKVYRRQIAFLLILEIGLSLYMGLIPMLVHICALAFGLLNFENFFLGSAIHRNPTTKTISASLGAGLLAVSLMTMTIQGLATDYKVVLLVAFLNASNYFVILDPKAISFSGKIQVLKSIVAVSLGCLSLFLMMAFTALHPFLKSSLILLALALFFLATDLFLIQSKKPIQIRRWASLAYFVIFNLGLILILTRT